MLRALFYLQVTSVRGRILSRLKRLRQPKYLIGAVIGVAYLYFIFFSRATRGGRYRPDTLPPVPEEVFHIVAGIGALGLLLAAVASWILPRGRAGLTFSEAEIAFLFPAPISRRTLIHYRLLSSQVGLAITALILTLVSNRWQFLGGNAITHAIGWWIILGTLNLHFMGSGFMITRLLDRGVTSLRRALIGIALIVALIGGFLYWVRSGLRAPEPGELRDLRTVVVYFGELLSTGPLYWVLALPRMVIAPFIATDVLSFFAALPAALLILLLHYFWIMRAEVSFEEASLAKAEKRAAKRMAIKQGDWRANVNTRKGQRDPFPLRPIGRPEIAFIWKNLLASRPVARVHHFLLAAGAIVAGCTWLKASMGGYHPALYAISGMATMGALTFAFIGPQIVRHDLRMDLQNADLLKTYPLPGWQMMLGQLLAPLFVLTMILWLLLLASGLSFPPGRVRWLTPELRITITAALAILVPPFMALQLLIPNAAAILFPAWTQAVSNRADHGLDMLGQRIIFVAGQFLITALALLPCAAVAAVLFFATRWVFGLYSAIAVSLLGVIGILLFEFWVGVRWLGTRFEKFDLSSELRP